VVRTLVDENLARDYHSFEWNGRDDSGRAVGSGVYIYQLRVGRRTLSQKMVLMK
jgi:flagellar hook assembly protein FlgD